MLPLAASSPAQAGGVSHRAKAAGRFALLKKALEAETIHAAKRARGEGTCEMLRLCYLQLFEGWCFATHCCPISLGRSTASPPQHTAPGDMATSSPHPSRLPKSPPSLCVCLRAGNPAPARPAGAAAGMAADEEDVVSALFELSASVC